MEELTLDGKAYISTKRAAAITGYAKDYVGQLCREGRVEARLVGRSWYVLEESLREHRFNSGETAEAQQPGLNQEHRAEDAPVYTPEEMEVIPVLKPVLEEVLLKPRVFQEEERRVENLSATLTPPPSREKPESVAVVRRAPAELELRQVVTDIAPVPAYPAQYAVHTADSRQKRPGHKHKGSKQTVTKALLIAVIVLTLSLAAAISGVVSTVHIGGPFNLIINYLGGTSSLK